MLRRGVVLIVCTAAPAPPGRKLTFPSGVFAKLVKGRWYKTTEGRYEIALTSLKSGFESEYCTQEK